MYSAYCAYAQLPAKVKASNGIQLIPLLAKLYVLTVGLLCTEARAPFATLYKSIVYLTTCVPAGLHSPKETPFF